MDDCAAVFQFSKTAPIWIYGCGHIGKSLRAKLLANGFKVVGFIDRDKSRTEDLSCEIIDPEQSARIDDSAIIILSFQNVLEHERVSKVLAEQGLSRIVYLYRDTQYYPKTYECYNALLYGNEIQEFQFPLTLQAKSSSSPFITRIGDFVITDVPVQLVYSDKLPIDASKPFESVRNFNICSMPDYNALFDYCLRGKYNSRHLNCYLERLRRDRTKEAFLADRFELCARFMQELGANGLESFRVAPAFAVFDKSRGRFIVEDGHHRSCFLANVGLDAIPLRMTANDYDCWVNEKASVQLLRTAPSNLTIDGGFREAVLNPLASGGNSTTRRSLHLSVLSLADFFGEVNLDGMSVLDMYSRLAFFSRFFVREGAQSVVAYEPREVLSGLSKQINQLEFADAIEQTNVLPMQTFDIVIWANDVALDLGRYGDILVSLCGRYLVAQLAEDDIKAKTALCDLLDCRDVWQLCAPNVAGGGNAVFVFERNVRHDC